METSYPDNKHSFTCMFETRNPNLNGSGRMSIRYHPFLVSYLHVLFREVPVHRRTSLFLMTGPDVNGSKRKVRVVSLHSSISLGLRNKVDQRDFYLYLPLFVERGLQSLCVKLVRHSLGQKGGYNQCTCV